MNKVMQRLVPGLNDHLSDSRMAGLLSRDLPFAQRLLAMRHLAACCYCRALQEDLEGRRADRIVRLYQAALEHEEPSTPATVRAEFARRLERHMQQSVPRKRWALRLPNLSMFERPTMDPTLAMSMLFGLATVVSLFFWWQQRVPNITSNALLVRAETWDDPSVVKPNSIVFQTVRITTPRQTLERSIYRDPQGKRQLKHATLAEGDEQLRATLSQAGVDWNEPISASSYQGWHDRQRVREDHIVRAGKHLLTLTTTVPDGTVAEQSLTVRDTDFHPVRRTVAFRDSETVEIAEVDFKILPWAAVDANVFEPIGNLSPVAATSPSRVIPFPRLPVSVSEGQLDETELGARLILNQMHADTGEQIELRRGSQQVEVVGLVETPERRQALSAQLKSVPHLKVSILSVADLKDTNSASAEENNIRTASMPEQPSPLEAYLQTRGRSVRTMNVLAEQLFNEALTISQESRAIGELQTRFVPRARTSVLASATLSELIYSHRERLQAALVQERELLAEAQGSSAGRVVGFGSAASSPADAPSLIDAAARNLALCKELTQTNRAASQSAEEILAQMAVSLDNLLADVHETYGKFQGDSTPGGKK
jgi:hypothetical protein